MNFEDFKKLSTVGGDDHARAAWDKAVEQIKEALPDHHAEIDAALAPEPEFVATILEARAAERATLEADASAAIVQITASDSGSSSEGQA